MRINIDNLSKFDQCEQQFGATVFLEMTFKGIGQTWKNAFPDAPEGDDMKHFANTDNVSLKPVVKTAVRLDVVNQLSHEDLEAKSFSLDGQDADVVLRWKFRGTFGEEMDFRDFPMDQQHFSVRIKLPVPADKMDLQLNHDESRFVSSSCSMDSMWKVGRKVKLGWKRTAAKESAHGARYFIISASVPAMRRSHFYVINLMGPMFLFVFGAWASFCVHVKDIADRLSVSVAFVLVSVAFRFTVPTPLPPVAYTTLLDGHTTVCNLLIAFIIFENAIVGRWFSDGQLDELLMIAVPTAFLLFELFFGLYMWRRWSVNSRRVERPIEPDDSDHSEAEGDSDDVASIPGSS